MGVLFSFRSIYEHDTEAYNYVYNMAKQTSPNNIPDTYGITKGFIYLMSAFARLGFSFSHFRLILYTISMALIFLTIKKIEGNLLLILCLYAFFPFGYDIDQIRQLLVTSIVIFAFQFIMKEEVKTLDIAKYLILIGIACIFHSSAPFYFLFLLILVKRTDFFYLLVSLCSFFFFGFMIFRADLLGFLGEVLNIEKLVHYSETLSDYTMNPILSIFEFVFVCYFIWNSNYCKQVNADNSILADKIWRYSCVSSIALPTLAYSLMFERLLRPMIWLNYALMIQTIKNEELDKDVKATTIVAFIVVIALRSSISLNYVFKIFENFSI